MEKKLFAILTCVLFTLGLSAQEEKTKLTTKFYGFVRGDFAYDTRQSVAANEGLFFLYPKDELPDANGKDLNDVSNSGFYAFNSRLGVDVSGYSALNADLSAKIEADFAGFSGTNGNSTVLRIRRAFLKMNWEDATLLLGQEWHPMFSNVIPDVISLSAGAPFNVFNRSPQLRLDYKINNIVLSGSILYQLQYTSAGPDGKTNNYQRNANVPELYLGAEYKNNGLSVGAFIDYLTLKPRTQTSVETPSGPLTYKVDEHLNSFSYGAYAGYNNRLFSISAKTIFGQNLSDMCMLGGYGITKKDANTGEQEYTNFKHTSSWLNISYGKKYKGNLFAGFTKNLGTEKALLENSAMYGDGLSLDQLYRLVGTFSYNVSRFSLGVEYEMTTADYGDADAFNWKKGKYDKSHGVTNHRIVGVVCYNF